MPATGANERRQPRLRHGKRGHPWNHSSKVLRARQRKNVRKRCRNWRRLSGRFCDWARLCGWIEPLGC